MGKFRKVHIENFRGILRADVNGLEDVNLFFGKNNCGKSSMLEAMFLLTGQSNPLLPVTVNQLRHYFSLSEQDLNLDFYNLQTSRKISISSEGDENRNLSISVFKEHDVQLTMGNIPQGFNMASATYGLQMDFYRNGENVKYHSTLRLNTGDESNGKIEADPSYQEAIVAQYLPSSYMQIPFAQSFVKIVENKQEKDIVAILQNIEPRIRDVQLVGNSLLVDVGLQQRLPMNLMGDGLRKLMAIVLAIYACKGGMLFIDEIDNGFHFSAMPYLWKAVLGTCEITNTQLFVSTHNIDSLKGLVTCLKDASMPTTSTVAAFKLIKKDSDEVEAVKYDISQLSYAIEQEMEVR